MDTCDNYSIVNIYNEYMKTDSIIKYINKLSITKKNKQELLNALERLLISTSQQYMDINIDNGIIYKINDNFDELFSKFIYETSDEKSILNNEQLEDIRNIIISDIDEMSDENYSDDEEANLIYNILTYKNFKVVLNDKDRYLLRMSNNDIDNLIKTKMLYKTILSRGNQWSLPQDFYDYMYEMYNAKNEAFASPFNSKLIKKKNTKFCSLFECVDYKYSSIGDFFKVNMLEHSGTWIINPPFIEKIMENVIIKLLESLKSATIEDRKLLCVYVMPAWYDTSAYNLLTNEESEMNKFILDSIVLNRGRYYYENEKNKSIKANFDSLMFVIGVNVNKFEYEEILNYYL